MAASYAHPSCPHAGEQNFPVVLCIVAESHRPLVLNMMAAVSAGTVSLMLSQNDDYPDLKQARDYHDMQFLITTGPGGLLLPMGTHGQTAQLLLHAAPQKACRGGFGSGLQQAADEPHGHMYGT
jgi:hypothetical protein